ncbi:amidohydrolase/deacetylase family metallohydrolase [Daejeonella sp.]|uniref:amidohydrolase/deacetylase family metallohydrolase n=1 Tax=Daejeonella sp. TaxID=2805397 RepID=UPI0030C0DE66
MIKIKQLLFLLFIVSNLSVYAQQSSKVYGIIIKGGHVIDPKNNIDEVLDVAINDGKIALIAKSINADQATQVVDAAGMYVSPGLIDIHSRLGYNMPDGYTLRVGVTTIVDAGDSDYESFANFKKQIIDKSVTRVLAFLNINGDGYKGGAFEKSTGDKIASESAKLAMSSKDIVGFKVDFTGPDWTSVDRGVEAGNLANMPIMLDGGRNHPHASLEDLFFKHMRAGDIYTHTYTIIEDINARDRIVDQQTMKIRPSFLEAQKKGIIFDVGHGSAFRYSNAIPAMKTGFVPNTISTDISIGSINSFMKDMMNVMSKFLTMGMSLKDVVKASTWSPAKAIKREELGNLSPGAIADLVVFSLREGKFGFYETAGYKMTGNKKFECEITIKGGRIVYDLNGIATPLNNFFREGDQFRW